jgi:hypothetical protein
MRSALDEAFGSKFRPSVIEQRPFALYLHRDDGIGCNIFAQTASSTLNVPVNSNILGNLLGCYFFTIEWTVYFVALGYD